MNSESNQPLPSQTESSEKLNFQDYVLTTAENSAKPIPVWRLVVPLLIQAGLIMAVPAQAVYTHITGETVILQTIPVDPYDLLRGYSQTLRYDVSNIDTLKKLPGWAELVKQYPGTDKQYNPLAHGINLYVVLQEQKSTGTGIPKAWKPVRVSGDIPDSLAANEVALKGRYTHGFISYGLETYYMPEDQREDINTDISQARPIKRGQPQPIVVEIKVDRQGKSVPVSMWVRDRNYRF